MRQCYFIPNNMESFFLLLLLHSGVFFVSPDSAAFLSSKFHFGKGCADKDLISCAKQAFRSQLIYVQLKGNQSKEKGLLSSGKSVLREGEGTVMASENHRAMIINDTDNGSEQSAAITRDKEIGGRFMGDLCTRVSHQTFVFVKSQDLIRSSARKG